MYRIEHYLEPVIQRDVYTCWLGNLRDWQAKVAIVRRVARLANGHFGDHKFCRDGVWALRIDSGPGYRVYYAMCNDRLILLLCAGTKRTQQADIAIAVQRWRRYRTRGNDEKQTT
ncbi:MAG: type II toxin-antitoxin system RelE/ParE family toxin [Comamonadaceae bacterium]|nr:MAG: type II toxin-antitoxin system RelE/ParE family toxin [Comamonadaceae bacterium]